MIYDESLTFHPEDDKGGKKEKEENEEKSKLNPEKENHPASLTTTKDPV